ncbi:MAG: hypothetical protein A2744_00205 [Candidatus Buchananbacteria bacterium RIFCSPHIGHO2_01_FULL_44_11]|uniref:Uncharacterized protein n=1 Tax=Candidatus Buchananbacteria bacterium RIFCSPHIGHO2_01_FULL_44_11 TaxID=1797535 RepID=A0A1G1Y0G1_9BACT|nr:MAG: hypothetical protein A2744_00205 [Candidatus Buchananbacteria bacterium RIFCSPHIGHO2_01_FULL_44_11]
MLQLALQILGHVVPGDLVHLKGFRLVHVVGLLIALRPKLLHRLFLNIAKHQTNLSFNRQQKI